MFKAIGSLFGRKSVSQSENITASLLNRRHTLCNHLVRIYAAQIALLEPKLASNLQMVNYYTRFQDEYKQQLDSIKRYMNSAASANPPIPESDFKAILTTQIDNSMNQLETINTQIQLKDLTELDKGYTDELDMFFGHFHLNRIAASYALREYISLDPLIENTKVVNIVNNGIKTTSQVLGLNGYPVPKFIVNKERSDLNLLTTCLSPHIVHIMFEMFKNASIPSLNKHKPITVSIYEDKEDVTPVGELIKTELHERKFTLGKHHKREVNKDDMIIIEIMDEGGGMPISLVSKIWQFHYTTSNDLDRDTIHGFGMGLPLCKVFAEFNDGELKLVNREGDGVTIMIKLPRTYIV